MLTEAFLSELTSKTFNLSWPNHFLNSRHQFYKNNSTKGKTIILFDKHKIFRFSKTFTTLYLNITLLAAIQYN